MRSIPSRVWATWKSQSGRNSFAVIFRRNGPKRVNENHVNRVVIRERRHDPLGIDEPTSRFDERRISETNILFPRYASNAPEPKPHLVTISVPTSRYCKRNGSYSISTRMRFGKKPPCPWDRYPHATAFDAYYLNNCKSPEFWGRNLSRIQENSFGIAFTAIKLPETIP